MVRGRNARTWFAAVVAFALMLWWLALATPDDKREDVASDEPLAPQPSAAEPAQALPAQQRTPETKQAPAPETQPAAAPDPVSAPTADRAPEAPIPPDTRGFIDAISGAFDTDARDREAGTAETALQKFFRASSLPASAFRSVVCRKSVCRLELYWRPEYDKPYRALMDELAGGNAKTVATRAEAPDKNGGVPLDAYWLRSIGTLPQPAAK